MRTKSTFIPSLFLFCLIPVLTVAQVYTVTDLGPLSPTAINSWSQIVGNYNNEAYIWTFGHMRGLGKLTGGTFSSATAINDWGVVTGTADGFGIVISDVSGVPNQECSDLVQPFLWRGQLNGLGTVGANGGFPPGPEWCSVPFYSSGINDLGQVVGYTKRYSDDFQWGFSWTGADGMTLFGGSWPPTFVNGISNTEQIVGENGVEDRVGHATSWKNGATTDLNSSGGTDYFSYNGSANGVNDRGQIVGWSTIIPVYADSCYEELFQDSCPMHAALWSTTAPVRDLGTLPGDTLSAALKINCFGEVIGSSGNTAAFPSNDYFTSPLEVIGRPFVWSERNGMQDLNTLIRGNSGWVLNSATDINVWGQIVGEGTLNGQPHGFLLTPRNPFKF